jgi:hypothetical protein
MSGTKVQLADGQDGIEHTPALPAAPAAEEPAAAADHDPSCLDEQDVSLSGSVWDLSVLVGCEPFGSAGSAMAVLLMVLNLAVRTQQTLQFYPCFGSSCYGMCVPRSRCSSSLPSSSTPA